jgi:pimeloyl-ACP methyl ester carboxylesterase
MARRRTSIVAAVISVVAMAVAGCGQDDDSSRRASGTTTTAAPSTTQSREDVLFGGSERVAFPAPDGPTVIGRLWRGGSVGVVLAHGHSLTVGQRGWVPFPAHLYDHGFTVLTFNFRGFCDSVECSPSKLDYTSYWNDVVGAVDYLRSTGVESVFLVGASMGGIAVLRAVSAPGVEVDGVVSMSTPQWPSRDYAQEPPENDVTPERLASISEPILFAAGENETGFAADARSMHGAATGPAELLLVPSGLHSSQLVTHAAPEVVDQTRAAILAFIQAHSGG